MRADHEERDHAHVDGPGGEVCRIEGEREDYDGSQEASDDADLRLTGIPDFIAHARDDIPYLLAAIRASNAEVKRLRERLAMAWAFNAGGTFADRSDVQVRRAGPAGTHWFITRAASSEFDGWTLQRDGSWGGRNPQPFNTADEAFAALAAARKGTP